MDNRAPHLLLPAALLAALGLGFASWRYGQSGMPPEVHADGRPGPTQSNPVPAEGARHASPQPAGSASHGRGRLVASPQARDRRPRSIHPGLSSQIDAAIAEARSKVDAERISGVRGSACEIGVYVIDLASGAVLVERGAQRLYTPASNMKLVTTLAALILLPADWAFETHIDTIGELRGSTLEGDLVVRAGGDPFFVRDDPRGAVARVGRLAAQVAGAGIESVEGGLLLDLGTFDEAQPAPGWPEPKSQWWTMSYAMAAPLTVQSGMIDAEVVAGARPDDWCAVQVWPSPSGLTEEFSVRTVANSFNDVRIGLVDERSYLKVTGKYGGPRAKFTKTFRHPDPVSMFASVLSDQLQRRGVEIAGSTREVRAAGPGRPLGSVRSDWLELLEPINADSANSVADALLIGLGHARYGEGSRSAGSRAVRDVFQRLGLELEGFAQADGSGLSRDNRVSPELIGELLGAAMELDSDRRHAFLSSLALMGESGTLESRMRSTPAQGRVRAKSGWIRGASALSGLATTLEGREVVFSILVDYPIASGLNTRVFKPLQEAIVDALVTSGAPTVVR